MATYSKSSDSNINVVDAKGKLHRVTQRAYDVVYRNQGYKLASEVEVKTEAKPAPKKRTKKEETEVLGE
jgi:hypothetical protein